MSVDPTVVQDVVVVVPGIMGSELADRNETLVWSVTEGRRAVAMAIRTLGRSLKDLKLPDGIGDDHPGDGVKARGLVPSLHVIPGMWSPITGYSETLNFLRSHRFHLVEPEPREPDIIPNFISFPYDWRLSNRYNGRLLARVATNALERWRRQPGMAQAKLILICHSMGGLVARWFAEQEGGAELIRSIITIGTPHRGAANAIETLVNGLDPCFGPLHLDLSDFVRSCPAVYQLLPTYKCVVVEGGERVDLLSAGAPGLNRAMLEDAAAFHASLTTTERPNYLLHKVVGIRQPTATTVRFVDGSARLSKMIDGQSQGGDGTVPRLAAQPLEGWDSEVYEVADQHGHLQVSTSLLDLVNGIITRTEVIRQGVGMDSFGVEMADVWTTAERPVLRVTDVGIRRLVLKVLDEAGTQVGKDRRVESDGTADLGDLPEGGYRAFVTSTQPGGPTPVTKPFVVFDPTLTIEDSADD